MGFALWRRTGGARIKMKSTRPVSLRQLNLLFCPRTPCNSQDYTTALRRAHNNPQLGDRLNRNIIRMLELAYDADHCRES